MSTLPSGTSTFNSTATAATQQSREGRSITGPRTGCRTAQKNGFPNTYDSFWKQHTFYVHKNDHQRESEDVEQKRRRHRDISQPGPLPPQQINGRDRTDSPFSTSTADRNTSVTATSSSGWQSSENPYSVEADCASTDSPFLTSTADHNTSVTATSSSGWQYSENPYSVEADCANMDRWYPSVPGNLSTYYASNLTSIEEDLWDENLNLGNLSTHHESNFIKELPWDENLNLGNPSTYWASNFTSIEEPLWDENLIPRPDGSTSDNAIYPPIFDVPASSSHQETSTATQYLHPSPSSPQPEFDDLSHTSSSAPLGNGSLHSEAISTDKDGIYQWHSPVGPIPLPVNTKGEWPMTMGHCGISLMEWLISNTTPMEYWPEATASIRGWVNENPEPPKKRQRLR